MSVFPCLLSALLLPSFCFAVPKEVTIFPNLARVTETTKAQHPAAGKEPGKAVIILPAQADPDSFIAYFPTEARLKIEDLTWRRVTNNGDVRTKDLRKRVSLLNDEKNSSEAALESLNAQNQFWQQQTKARAKPSEAGAVAAAIGRNIKKIYQEKVNLAYKISELDKKLKELERELKPSDDANQKGWEATILFSGEAAGETVITYSYTLTGCGWLPIYRLDARPQEGKIRFSREAEVWQNSGKNWDNIDVTLATGQPPASFMPDDLTPRLRIIVPRPEAKQEVNAAKTKRPGKKRKAELQTSFSEEDSADGKTTPSCFQGAPISLNAGLKAIPSGAHHKIKITEELWNADFIYLSRPAQCPEAFISALLRFPEMKELPAGTAFFFRDGAMLGKKTFALSGQDETLFFGRDSLVTVTSLLISKQDGRAPPLKEKKSYIRQWRFDAHNSHPFPVRLHIEEASPRFSDDRIKITLKHDPPAAEKPELLIWELELPGGEKKSVHFGMDIETPADVEIIF